VTTRSLAQANPREAKLPAKLPAKPASPPSEAHHDQDRSFACVCNDGWVSIGQGVIDEETGEEAVEYAMYLCQRCAEEERV
jgi:hypothetical protein